MKKLLAIMLGCMLFAFQQYAMAEEADVWQLITEEGAYLTSVCYEPEAGDEYISGDNKLYQVIRLEGNRAVMRLNGDFDLPDVSWLSQEEAMAVSSMPENRKIALYCTHSDESYEPTDGKYSDEQRGSIYTVAESLAAAFEERGVEAEVSDALHHPHDAGAYRRSRQTAVQLMKSMPDAMFDIHRDGIPDPDEYAVTIGGQKMSKVRLLVGRGNQNMETNKKLAARIKAVADSLYPGLIKDIYMGKGTYNQDLSPQSLLFECGTYTISRERVEASLPLLANAVTRSLYGGLVGSAGSADVRNGSSNTGDSVPGATDTPAAIEDSSGAGSGLLWLVGLFVVGLIVYAFAATGSASGAGKKVSRNISEMTGGLIGKKPEDDEKQ